MTEALPIFLESGKDTAYIAAFWGCLPHWAHRWAENNAWLLCIPSVFWHIVFCLSLFRRVDMSFGLFCICKWVFSLEVQAEKELIGNRTDESVFLICPVKLEILLVFFWRPVVGFSLWWAFIQLHSKKSNWDDTSRGVNFLLLPYLSFLVFFKSQIQALRVHGLERIIFQKQTNIKALLIWDLTVSVYIKLYSSVV